jgi:predicted nucleic acid-binding protein
MIVVDASVLVAVYLPGDHFHVASRTWLRRYLLGGQRIVAPTLLAAEVAGAVARQTSSIRGEQALRGLLNLSSLRMVTTNRQVMVDAALVATAFRLRGADAIYVAVAQRLGVPLLTWDNDHMTRAGGAIAVYTPDTAP